MFQLHVPETELWDEYRKEFIYISACDLHLEHSLISLSKWESKWKEPFLVRYRKEPLSRGKLLDYIRCMAINASSINPNTYYAITDSMIKSVSEYINDKMSAAVIKDKTSGGGSGEQVTADLIYYWMIELGIPFECEKWHLNRLMTLIRICEIKSRGPGKKMPLNSQFARNNALNSARRSRLRSKG